MTAMGEHAPIATSPPSSSKYAKRFGVCLVGYLAGCAASATWVSLLSGFQSGIPAGHNSLLETFFAAFVFTGLFASHSAPVLILIAEILKLRAWLAYVGLAIVSAFVSCWTWIDMSVPDAGILLIIAGAGAFSGFAFWLVAVRGHRIPAIQQAPTDGDR